MWDKIDLTLNYRSIDMQTEIKIVDCGSKLINWNRVDYLMERICKVSITIIVCCVALKGLLWLSGV